MKELIKTAIVGSAAFAPFLAFAATNDTLIDVFQSVGALIAVITPVVVAIALLAFFWGLAMYVLNFSGDDKDKKKGRDMMVYGILVLFVMVSVWGIVQVLQNTFLSGDVENQQEEIPCVEIPGVNIGECN